MGRDWVKKQERKGGSSGGTAPLRVGRAPLRVGSKPKPVAAMREDAGEEGSEDGGGRSSLGRVKRRKVKDEKAESGGMVEDADDVSGGARIATTPVGKRPSKRGTSYLDEILAVNAEKEQKRQRRKARNSNAMDQIDSLDDR